MYSNVFLLFCIEASQYFCSSANYSAWEFCAICHCVGFAALIYFDARVFYHLLLFCVGLLRISLDIHIFNLRFAFPINGVFSCVCPLLGLGDGLGLGVLYSNSFDIGFAVGSIDLLHSRYFLVP